MQSTLLCRALSSAEHASLQSTLLCRACSAEESALQRRALCKEACSAKKRALQRSVLCRGECSAKECALQRSVLCRALSFAEHTPLQSTLLCRARFFAELLCGTLLCRALSFAEHSPLQSTLLRLLGRSLPDEELGGLEQAASVQQQRGPRQRPGAAAAGQPERQGLPGAGRRDAPVRAHHDQRRGAGADEEPLHAAVPDHEPEEPRLPRDRGQHGQRGLQHELHEFVGQQKTEMAEADVAELKQLFDSVEDGHCPVERRHGDGHARLLSPHQRAVGGAQGLPGPAGRGGSLAGPAGPEERVKKTVRRPPREDPCSSSFLGQQVGVFRPPCIQGLFFLNGGAETCGTHGSCTDLRGSATST